MRGILRLISPLLLLCATAGAQSERRQTLQQALGEKFPPPGWNTIRVNWDLSRPWKDARLEVRRLLAGGGDEAKQGAKLTWLYKNKGDIGDGHEWPMYLFMSGNYAWAVQEYPAYIRANLGRGGAHAYRSYASCLAYFAAYDKALEVLNQALNDLPKPPWTINAQAGLHDQMGDLCARKGDVDEARRHYDEAMRLYPTSNQPNGRHLLARNVAKIKAKVDLLSMQSLAKARLRDGSYTARTPGYSDKVEIAVTLTVRAGRLVDLQVQHEEKIELGSAKAIPKQIVQKQSLQVDVVTGATVTSQAIINGALDALRQAGLQ